MGHLSGLLVAFAVAVAVVTAGALHASANPHLASQTFGRASAVIPVEGAAWEVTTVFDGVNGRVSTNISTADGWYMTLRIADLQNVSNGKIYFVFPNPTTGGMFCYPYTVELPAPFPPQRPLPGTLVRQTTFQGKLYNVYRITVNSMVVSLFVEANPVGETIEILSADTEGMGNMKIGTVVNGSIPAGNWFDVPAACQAQEAINVDTTHEGLKADDTILTMIGSNAAGLETHSAESAIHEASMRRAALTEKSKVFRATSEELRSVPASLDNRRFATPIRNQGGCGGCWTFSSAASTEIAFNFVANRTFPEPEKAASQWLAVQNLIDCAHEQPNDQAMFPSKGCLGGWPLTAMNYIKRNGIAFDKDYTYDAANGRQCKSQSSPQRLTDAIYIPFTNGPKVNLGLIQAAVVKYGAVVVVLNANPLLKYRGGIFNDIDACPPTLGHAVTIVGWGTASPQGKPQDYWLIKNSFGSGWGEAGYLRIARGVNMCGVEQMGFIPVA